MEHGSTQKSGATTTPMKRVPTSDRCSIARESGEPSRMGKQKTASAGAPRDDATKWARVEWAQARREVRRLQVRIAKAVTEGRWNKVRTLQHLLTRSFYAKLLAVKRVTSNLTEVRSRGAQQGHPSGMLEPYDGKLSRTVLRGTGGRKAPWSTRSGRGR